MRSATGIYIIIIIRFFFLSFLPIDNVRHSRRKMRTAKNGQSVCVRERESVSKLRQHAKCFYPCEYNNNTCYPLFRSDVVVVVYTYLITNDSLARFMFIVTVFFFFLIFHTIENSRESPSPRNIIIIIIIIIRAPEMKASRGNDCCAGHNV